MEGIKTVEGRDVAESTSSDTSDNNSRNNKNNANSLRPKIIRRQLKDDDHFKNDKRRGRRRVPKSSTLAFWLFLLLPLTNGQRQYKLHQQQQQGYDGGGTESVSIRLIDEILEIFVPPDKFGIAKRNSPQGEEVAPIPYGFNRLMLPRTARSRDLAPERMVQEDAEMDTSQNERRFSPISSNNNHGAVSNGDEQQAPWANLAREVLKMFRNIETTTPTTTTTTTTTEMSLLEKIFPKLLSPFGFGTTAPPPTAPPFFPFFMRTTTPAPSPPSFLSSLFRQEQPKKEQPPINPLVEPVARLFGVEKKAVDEGRAQIDTGGPNFDRFVVREKMNPDNPLTAIIGGAKWNERGIKWEDGNIRLVNKNGNSFLGSEVGVNDRSVDIPLKRWLDIANGFVQFNQAQQERVRRW